MVEGLSFDGSWSTEDMPRNVAALPDQSSLDAVVNATKQTRGEKQLLAAINACRRAIELRMDESYTKLRAHLTAQQAGKTGTEVDAFLKSESALDGSLRMAGSVQEIGGRGESDCTRP